MYINPSLLIQAQIISQYTYRMYSTVLVKRQDRISRPTVLRNLTTPRVVLYTSIQLRK